MPTIAHVKWPTMKIDYGWMFKISSYSGLMSWWMDVKQNSLREGFANYINSNEFVSLAGVGLGQERHLSHREAAFLNAACLTESMKDNPRSVVEIFCDITDAVYRGMEKVLQEQGHLYVNKNGGYFHLGTGMEEVGTKQTKEFVIPGAKIDIKKWPNGVHFYAYVGGVSVEVGGKNKWDTRTQATANAEMWARKNNVSLEDF